MSNDELFAKNPKLSALFAKQDAILEKLRRRLVNRQRKKRKR